jgi:hypothetical protein
MGLGVGSAEGSERFEGRVTIREGIRTGEEYGSKNTCAKNCFYLLQPFLLLRRFQETHIIMNIYKSVCMTF